MTNILIALFLLVVLVRSADVFIDHAIALAKKLKINSFIIGLTVVAFGTSLPEFVVSTYSTISGHPQIAIANVIGSNIANLCLVLGIIAVYKGFKLSKKDVMQNIPVGFLSIVLFTLMLSINDLKMNFIVGVASIVIFIFFIFISTRSNGHEAIKSEVNFNPFFMVLALVMLIFSGKLAVDNIILAATDLGIKETTLGYFILAIGTSLPELVVTLSSLKRGNTELGLGNLLGSNLVNVYLTLSVSSFIRTLHFGPHLGELTILAVITLIVLVFAHSGKRYFFSRLEGIGLMLFYVLFVVLYSIEI